jgi:hypothetical protein
LIGSPQPTEEEGRPPGKVVLACYFAEQVLFQLRVGQGLKVCSDSVASGSLRHNYIKEFSNKFFTPPFLLLFVQ